MLPPRSHIPLACGRGASERMMTAQAVHPDLPSLTGSALGSSYARSRPSPESEPVQLYRMPRWINADPLPIASLHSPLLHSSPPGIHKHHIQIPSIQLSLHFTTPIQHSVTPSSPANPLCLPTKAPLCWVPTEHPARSGCASSTRPSTFSSDRG